MTLASWDQDSEFARKALPHWKYYFKKFFGQSLYKIEDYDTDLPIQKSYWDFNLVFLGKTPPHRVEVKTRRLSYFPIYERDCKIVVELKGNIERDKIGSGIENCNAELWAYGFFNGHHIVSPTIFDKAKLKNWMLNNPDKYISKITKGTRVYDNTFHTLFGLVRLNRIADSIILNPNMLFERFEN